ncbi:DUF11 domain-containing protein [Herpetosiphon llansteffanensis]
MPRFVLQFVLLIALIVSFNLPVAQAQPQVLLAPDEIQAVADDQFWNNSGLIAGANNTIRALSSQSGDLFVGGLFDRIAGISANRVAFWDGNHWNAMGSGVNGPVDDLDASTGGSVYVVGSFSSAGGIAADGIARWNSGTGQWSALATNVNGAVTAVLVQQVGGNDVVYVGGTFTSINGVSANRIAKFSNGAWSGLSSGISGGSAPQVFDLAVNPANVNQIVAGGTFSSAGGSTANNVAIWTGSAWQSLGTGSSNGVNNTVRFVDFRGTNMVVVGGSFSNAGTITNVGGAAVWQGSNAWQAMAGRGVAGDVRGIVENVNFTYVMGNFGSGVNPNGNSVFSPNIARWDGNIWSPVPNASNALGTNGAILRTERFGSGSDSFFIAGAFGTAHGLELNFVGMVLPQQGFLPGAVDRFFPLAGGLEGANAKVFAIQPRSGQIIAAGRFDLGSNRLLNNIASFDPVERVWSPLAGSNDSGVNDDVRDLALRGTDLIAVGEFSKAGGVDAAGVASWNGSTWTALATSINGRVNAVAVSGSDIYIGGEFTQVDGVPANRIARLSGGVWQALGAGSDGAINSLLFKSGQLYAGGLFANAGGAPASNLARWNGTTWQAIGTGTNGEVLALADVNSSTLAVGGRFTSAGGVANTRAIALLNHSSLAWTALGTGTDGYVTSLAVRGDDLYAGGLFNRMDGLTVNHVARWNGSNWNALGSGVAGGNLANSEVGALAINGDNVYVGGRFDRAGDKVSHRFAEWRQPEVDLSLKLTDSPDPVTVGNAMSYRANVSNLGTISASSVVYEQNFASTLVFGQVTTSQGTCSFPTATTLRCNLGTVAANASATITINATPSQVGLISSTGTASSPANEAFPSNNSRTLTTQVIVPGNPVPTISNITPDSFIRQPIGFPPPPAVRITVNGTGFVANSKVVVAGTEHSTSFISSNRLEFSMPATTNQGLYSVLVRNPTPGGGDSNSVSLRVSFGIVGVSSITPNVGGTDVDLQTTFSVSWTHTTDPWRIIEHLDLRLVDGDGVALWARFTEGVSGTFSLLDSNGDVLGYATAGTTEPLESDSVILDLADSTFAGSGPTGFSMQVDFTVRFKASAAGRRYNIELYATDDNGGVQGPDVMGTFTVGIHNVYLPMTIK